MSCFDMKPEHADRIFFSDNPAVIRQAKRICGGCPEKNQCVVTATQQREMYGVWGGESAPERRKRLGINCYGSERR